MRGQRVRLLPVRDLVEGWWKGGKGRGVQPARRPGLPVRGPPPGLSPGRCPLEPTILEQWLRAGPQFPSRFEGSRRSGEAGEAGERSAPGSCPGNPVVPTGTWGCAQGTGASLPCRAASGAAPQGAEPRPSGAPRPIPPCPRSGWRGRSRGRPAAGAARSPPHIWERR